MFRVPKKLLLLVLALVLTWVHLTTYALAYTYSPKINNSYQYALVSDDSYLMQSPIDFFKNCIFSQPSSGLGEVVCTVGKTFTIGGIITGICYTGDAMAASVFPPAAAFAPVCNYIGIASGGLSLLKPAK